MEATETYKTLRDEIAIAAMQGDWAAQQPNWHEFTGSDRDEKFNNSARLYYRMADAMLREREAA